MPITWRARARRWTTTWAAAGSLSPAPPVTSTTSTFSPTTTGTRAVQLANPSALVAATPFTEMAVTPPPVRPRTSTSALSTMQVAGGKSTTVAPAGTPGVTPPPPPPPPQAGRSRRDKARNTDTERMQGSPGRSQQAANGIPSAVRAPPRNGLCVSGRHSHRDNRPCRRGGARGTTGTLRSAEADLQGGECFERRLGFGAQRVVPGSPRWRGSRPRDRRPCATASAASSCRRR